MPDPFKDYLRALEHNLGGGNATEHTHRPALITLLRATCCENDKPSPPRCGGRGDKWIPTDTPVVMLSLAGGDWGEGEQIAEFQQLSPPPQPFPIQGEEKEQPQARRRKLMMEPEKATSAEVVFKPCGRAFFVYYVAMAICFLGPRINPAVGVPVWLGDVLGLMVTAAVVYMKWGQEYRLTPRGVAKVVRWPSPHTQEITWPNLGEVLVRRGLTQTLLRVGNLVLTDNSGGPQMFWFGLLNPKEVKEEIERRRA